MAKPQFRWKVGQKREGSRVFDWFISIPSKICASSDDPVALAQRYSMRDGGRWAARKSVRSGKVLAAMLG